MELLAPAKINLSLVVKGRRDDGFHEIESLMVPVSVFDRLKIERAPEPGIEFVCDDATLPTDDTNLVVRAARLFCAAFGVQPALRIALEKHIPHGAGLGGGSSDAASVLLALDLILQTQKTREALAEVASQIGSDVAFFLYESAALVSGRGEKVAPRKFGEKLPLLLVKPPFGVPTPWAYQRWRDASEVPGVLYAPQALPWGAVVNDLERPVFEKYVFLALVKQWLLAQPEVAAALMSGSGSTVFAILREKASGPALEVRVRSEFGSGLWCRLCETIG